MNAARTSRIMTRALRLVWQSARRWSLATLLLVVLQAALAVLSLKLTELVVDAVAEALLTAEPTESFSHIALLMGAQAVVILATVAAGSLVGLTQNIHGQIFSDHMQGVIHAKSIELDLEHYETPRYHDILHRAQEDAPYRPTQVLNALAQSLQHGISFLAMAALLLTFHWSVTLIIFAAALPAVLVGARNARKAHQLQLQQTPDDRRTGYFHWILTGDIFAKELRLFGLGPWLKDRFQETRTALRRDRVRLLSRRLVEDLGAQAIAMIAVFGIYIFLAYRAVQGAVTIGELVMFFLALRRAQTHIDGAFRGLSGLYENGLFLSNVFELLSLKKTVKPPKSPLPFPRPITSGIVFHDVSFRYPAATRDCLQSVELEIKPGEKVALVGANGSGKTTLVKLLCRLYDPTGGFIAIDGVDLREFDLADLRGDIGVVFQDFAKYFMTARDNIRFGRIDADPTDDAIAAAARQAGAEEIIQALPKGYDTILGKWFDEGEELSIGEWQKIALARAFFRQSQVIVLDEPTSALDPKAEQEFFETFRHLAQDKTALLISHRFSTVKSADYICVLEDGGIIEIGSHDELVRLGGTYAEMYDLQSRSYR